MPDSSIDDHDDRDRAAPSASPRSYTPLPVLTDGSTHNSARLQRKNPEQGSKPLLSQDPSLEEIDLESQLPPPSPQKKAAMAPRTKDGVFSNMVAKPKHLAQGASYIEQTAASPEPLSAPVEQPPEYETIASLCPPDYIETVYVTETVESTLIDGMYVGRWSTFFYCTLVSFAFDLAGFMISFLIVDSAAGKCGGLVGLGLNVIFTVISHRNKARNRPPPNPTRPAPPDATALGVAIGLFSMFIGLSYYVYIRRVATRRIADARSRTTTPRTTTVVVE